MEMPENYEESQIGKIDDYNFKINDAARARVDWIVQMLEQEKLPHDKIVIVGPRYGYEDKGDL